MSATMTSPRNAAPAALHALLQDMRRSVVQATLSSDLETKCALWAQYRRARAEAVALLGAPPAGP